MGFLLTLPQGCSSMPCPAGCLRPATEAAQPCLLPRDVQTFASTRCSRKRPRGAARGFSPPPGRSHPLPLLGNDAGFIFHHFKAQSKRRSTPNDAFFLLFFYFFGVKFQHGFCFIFHPLSVKSQKSLPGSSSPLLPSRPGSRKLSPRVTARKMSQRARNASSALQRGSTRGPALSQDKAAQHFGKGSCDQHHPGGIRLTLRAQLSL